MTEKRTNTKKHRTLTIPVAILAMAVLDSQRGYRTTVNAEQKVQIIPTITQATRKKKGTRGE